MAECRMRWTRMRFQIHESSRWSQKILLGNIDAGVAQDVVGRGDVEEELRHAEGQQQRSPGECSCRAVLEGENDLPVRCAINLRARQALYKIDRCCDP